MGQRAVLARLQRSVLNELHAYMLLQYGDGFEQIPEAYWDRYLRFYWELRKDLHIAKEAAGLHHRARQRIFEEWSRE